MRMIKDLLNTPEGRRFLEVNGITTDQEEFSAQMESPENPALQQYLGLGIRKPVYAFQQIYIDVTQSMVDRINLLDDLVRFEEIAPFFLWIDTDRAGSDKITTRMYWPHWSRVQSIPICSHAVKDIETRFVELDPMHLEAAIEKLGMYLVQSVSDKRERAVANYKHEKLKEQFLENHIHYLSEFNYRIANFLLNEYAGLDPVSVFVSDLVNNDLFTDEIETVLNHIDTIIMVFNQARLDLLRQEIDPVVKPLAEDYLPLNYSCPVCLRRLRLRRKIERHDQFAMVVCHCGETYRFHLGAGRLSIAELTQTRRWSPDVFLALFMNNMVSGFVGGQSSGIYFGLLMKAGLEKVLNKRRIPVLLPESLRAEPTVQFDSLIYRYLTDLQTEFRLPEGVL